MRPYPYKEYGESRGAGRRNNRRRSALAFRAGTLLLVGGGVLVALGFVSGRQAAFERAFLKQVAAFDGSASAGETLSAEAREKLQTVLRQGRPEARVEAAYELARWRDRASVGELVATMRDGSGVRRPCQIAHSLGRIGDPAALPALQEALDHPDNTDLRACAALAIGEIGDPSTLAFLLDRITDPELSEGSQASALIAVWDIASPAVIPDLRRIAATHPRNDLREMAAAAARALDSLTAAAPTEALLEELVGDRPWVRSGWILRQIERTWSVDGSATALNTFLRSRPELNRTETVWLTALLQHHRAWEAKTLRILAGSPQKTARWAAEIARSATSSHPSHPHSQAKL